MAARDLSDIADDARGTAPFGSWASPFPIELLAKGGITSSDTATEGLSIRRAWSRGTMLPGIVSLWEPVSGPAKGIPYIVFAGNVGDENTLAYVIDLFSGRTAQ